MSWNCYLGDTTTGLIDCPIDIASFNWAMSVSDSSMSTTKDRGVGEDSASGLSIPWGAIPGKTAAQRASAVASLKRYLCLCWKSDKTDDEGDPNDIGIPMIFGAIGQRTDTWSDTSFDLQSMFSLLQNRYLVEEGTYGTGAYSTTKSSIRLEKMSYRGIAATIGDMCTGQKPGGTLPIDWQYIGEKGSRAREYKGYDIQNNSCAQLMDNLTNVIDGPDMQFRPYLADESHIRVKFIAGSDADMRLGQKDLIQLTCFPGGGTLQNIQIDHDAPYMRVYASGSGTDEAQICHLSEDLTLVKQTDPYPLMETVYSDSDTDDPTVLVKHSDEMLDANCRPIMQLSGEIDFNDEYSPNPGEIWPGELLLLDIEGFPTLPDNQYQMRLMEMSGDQSSRARLIFDVYMDPVY